MFDPKAADSLGYTQSAVSQMVQAIEEELSTTLIFRSRNGISLTPDGEQFLPYIKKVCYVYTNKKTLPISSRYFIDFLVERFKEQD